MLLSDVEVGSEEEEVCVDDEWALVEELSDSVGSEETEVVRVAGALPVRTAPPVDAVSCVAVAVVVGGLHVLPPLLTIRLATPA